jgi:hypothetical protein
LDHGLHVLKPRTFPPNRRISTSHNPNQNRAALWQFFSYNKSSPANRKTGFHATPDSNKQDVGFIFAEAAQNFELLSILQSEIKKPKTYSG